MVDFSFSGRGNLRPEEDKSISGMGAGIAKSRKSKKLLLRNFPLNTDYKRCNFLANRKLDEDNKKVLKFIPNKREERKKKSDGGRF